MNNTTKPVIQILTFDENDRKGSILESIMLFAHYLITFPVFLLCWYTIVSLLRRRGHLSQSEEQSMMEEIKTIPIKKNIVQF